MGAALTTADMTGLPCMDNFYCRNRSILPLHILNLLYLGAVGFFYIFYTYLCLWLFSIVHFSLLCFSSFFVMTFVRSGNDPSPEEFESLQFRFGFMPDYGV